MSKFTDAQGRIWNIVLNVGVLRRVKAESGVDLGGFFDEETFTRLFISDSILAGEVLCSICRPNFDAVGINEDGFYAELKGDALADGRKALEDAFLDFCPSRDRERVSLMFKALAMRIKKADAQAKVVIGREMEKDDDSSGKPSAGAPESSA